MFTLSIISQKGGTGKTTVAVQLAATAAKVGEAVVVIDLDPQTNALNWKDRREAENPVVLSVQVSRLRQTVETARANGADLVIIDTAGKAESAAIEAARLSDLVLVPSLGDVFDMETLPTVRTLIRAGGDPPAFVLYNAIHPQGSKIADQLKAMTADYCGLPACPVHLTRRATHSDAALQGKAVHEIEPQGKADAEFERLYLFIKDQEKAKHGEERNRTGKRA
jgi:chromosome partitioning protein